MQSVEKTWSAHWKTRVDMQCRGPLHLNLYVESSPWLSWRWAGQQRLMNNWEAQGISGSCNAFCCSVTCTAWLSPSCPMAVRWSARNSSLRASPNRLPVERWPWWRGQGLREKVLTALCRWRFYKQRRALVWRGVCCCFPCSGKEDTSGSLELRKDFTFYKLILK